MKFALAAYGSRGDVEPGVAVARELLGRGHDVHIALPPDKLGLAESAGLAAVGYGPDSRDQIDAAADLIDVALRLDGTFYLPYQLYYSMEQLRQAYPEIDSFFASKKEKKTITNRDICRWIDSIIHTICY